MPCNDVSEQLQLTVDYDDRLVFYALAKGTCNGAVGKPSLLRKWIRNRTVSDILSATPRDLWDAFPTRSRTWQFLYAKHLFAVQRGLQVLTGSASGRVEDQCSIASIVYGPNGIEMRAEIRIDLMADEIKACSNCCSD